MLKERNGGIYLEMDLSLGVLMYRIQAKKMEVGHGRYLWRRNT